MSYLEKATAATTEISDNLASLPELNDTLSKLQSPENARENPILKIGRTYVDYLRIIRDLATIQPDEVALIRKANVLSSERGISTNSASHGGADHFLEILGPVRQKQLLDSVLASANVNSNIFKEAIADLSNRMTKGHELSISNAPRKDGDPDADLAIWGHTMGLQPEAMIHFVMCHFLERTITAQFANDPDSRVRELVSKKDTLLAAMGDILRLRQAQGKASSKILDIWEKSRDQGGLQWNKPARQQVYNEVVVATKQN